MTSNIVTALGYMAPPDLVHLFLDNAWLDWGRGAECLTYLPGTVIEHMHPAAGKAANDAGYLEANSQTRFTADRDAYEQYTATQLADDIKKLEALKEQPPMAKTTFVLHDDTVPSPGGYYRLALDLPGTRYHVEWFAPGAGTHITTSIALEDG